MKELDYDRLLESTWRREITVWDKCDYDQGNHIYVTQGTRLIAYQPIGGALKVFNQPNSQWSPSRRKFEKLTKKEIRTILDAQ